MVLQPPRAESTETSPPASVHCRRGFLFAARMMIDGRDDEIVYVTVK